MTVQRSPTDIAQQKSPVPKIAIKRAVVPPINIHAMNAFKAPGELVRKMNFQSLPQDSDSRG